MDRTQKKCVIASTGVHLLLALILLVGPAFLSAKSQPDNLPVLDFIPIKTVDALISGGGNPNAKPPPSASEPQPQPLPPPPQPAVLPPKEKPIVKEEPKEEVVKPPKVDPDSLEPVKERKKLPEVSTKVVTRSNEKAEKARAEAHAEAKALADARKRLARQIGQAADNISNEVSGTTSIEFRGPGGGGVPYANWLQSVKTIYDRAWIAPDGAADGDATVTVSVTIARDGKVISGRILNASGNSAIDRSVQAALDRVSRVVPLPDDAKEEERTVDIRFNAKAKRASA